MLKSKVVIKMILFFTLSGGLVYSQPPDDGFPVEEIPVNGNTWTLIGAGALFSAYFLFKKSKQA